MNYNNLSFTEGFTQIYERNIWGCGSGSGSRIMNTTKYNEIIIDFIKENKIKTITDLGCGDWQSTYLIHDSLMCDHYDFDYLGIDCVNSLIENNKKMHPDYNFIHSDFFSKKEEIRDSELYIIKDVIQHWKLDRIYNFLDYLTENKNFKYIIITNSGDQSFDNQDKINDFGSARPLHSRFLPLKKYKAVTLLDYTFADEYKHMCIINKK